MRQDTRGVALGGAAFVFAVYVLTASPWITWWDAAELSLASAEFGIPHPPGTPLYIALGRSAVILSAGALDVEFVTTVLSALAGAATIGLAARLMARWSQDARVGMIAALCAAFLTSVWRNANETEAYAVAALLALVMLTVAEEAGTAVEAGQWRRRFGLLLYLAGLAWAVHPWALVALPAALWLAWGDGARRARWAAEGAKLLALLFLGLSALLILFVRARHDPWLNQGDPSTWERWWAVVTRAQYGGAGLLDRQAPVWAQIGNVGQYLDWQFAASFGDGWRPTVVRGLATLAAMLLVVVGARAHWRRDRRTAVALGLLALGGTLGVAALLNFKLGPSYAVGSWTDGWAREARERDYFYALGFLGLGLWLGWGAVLMAVRLRVPRLALLLPLALLAANLEAAARGGLLLLGDEMPMRFARETLDATPPRTLLLAEGDNELYPLWFSQRVVAPAPEVVVVALPLLPTRWYRDELRRRYGLEAGADWAGVDAARVQLERSARAIGWAVREVELHGGEERWEGLWSPRFAERSSARAAVRLSGEPDRSPAALRAAPPSR